MGHTTVLVEDFPVDPHRFFHLCDRDQSKKHTSEDVTQTRTYVKIVVRSKKQENVCGKAYYTIQITKIVMD
jgi:hypothetical protein